MDTSESRYLVPRSTKGVASGNMRWMAGVRTHPYGDQDRDLSPAALDELVEELHLGGEEHFGVGVTDESGWCLGAHPTGILVWENVESDVALPRHRTNVSVSEVRRLFGLLAEGDIATIEALEWQPGYGT
jgi:hypothetical protein